MILLFHHSKKSGAFARPLQTTLSFYQSTLLQSIILPFIHMPEISQKMKQGY